MQAFDLLIRNGRVVTTEGVVAGDIAIGAGKIAAIGALGRLGATRIIDAGGKFICPGGVDTHCHIEQMSGNGQMNADTFETATRSAAHGGTTCVVSFAAQHPGQSLRTVMEDYAHRAARGAIIDYAHHMIVSDLGEGNLDEHIPSLIAQGHRSIKLFTTYDRVRMQDEQILDVLQTARDNGAMVCIHAENDGMIRWTTRKLLAAGKTEPGHHVESHPRLAEIEALERMTRLAEYTGQPIMLFHISTREGVDVIRTARGRGVKVFAETCPHYLFMTDDVFAGKGIEGAKFLCSPPQRKAGDQEALWNGLERSDLQCVTSDHAPYRFDESGKLAHGTEAPFNRISNGMPGLELRLPLMFDAMVSRGRLGIEKFVELTATAPARIFGLVNKGRIAIGHDADLVIWDADRDITFGEDDLHDNVGYNPFCGRTIRGWPDTVISRGETIVSEGRLSARPGRGVFQPMALSPAMRPGISRFGPQA